MEERNTTLLNVEKKGEGWRRIVEGRVEKDVAALLRPA